MRDHYVAALAQAGNTVLATDAEPNYASTAPRFAIGVRPGTWVFPFKIGDKGGLGLDALYIQASADAAAGNTAPAAALRTLLLID